MDIKKWLENTVLPQPEPSLPEQLSLPPFLYPKEDCRAPSTSINKQRRKRRHTSSDSSFLETRQQRKRASSIERAVEIDNRPHDRPSTDASTSSDRSSLVSDASDQHYGRKPRHKTRPDIYEPKSDKVKERGTRKRRRGKGESKKTQAKLVRKKTERPGIGLVQRFHARNVPKDRLTLKPREKLGIFNKGRASSPVKGRGLPDLFFSEMKFLQKRKDAPEEQEKPETQRKRQRNDTTRANQEEISTYFTSMRPVLAEKHSNIQSKLSPPQQAPALIPEHKSKQQRSTSIESAIPTIELPEKPHLGFGSRGTRHESTSRLSWSSSLRQPSETPIFRRDLTTIEVGQLKTLQTRRDGASVNLNRPLSTVVDARRRRSDAGNGDRDRFSVSSLRLTSRGKLFAQNPRSQLHSPQKAVASNKKEIQGLKLQGEASSSTSPLCREAKRLRDKHPKVQSNDSITSAVAHSECLEPHSRFHSNSYDHTSCVKGGPEQQTSSTLSKLLRGCDSAFAKERQWQSPQEYARGMWTRNCALADDDTDIGTDMENYQEAMQSPNFALQQSRPPIPDQPELYKGQIPGGDIIERFQMYSGDIEGPGSMSRTDGEGVLLESYEGAMPQAPDESLSIGLRLSDPVEGLTFMSADKQERRDDKQGDDGVFAGFWRPNKLY